MKNIDWVKVRELYDKGWTDRKIGNKFHCGYQPIFRWRQKNDLPANHIGRRKIAVGVVVGVGVAVAAVKAYKAVKRRNEEKKE